MNNLMTKNRKVGVVLFVITLLLHVVALVTIFGVLNDDKKVQSLGKSGSGLEIQLGNSANYGALMPVQKVASPKIQSDKKAVNPVKKIKKVVKKKAPVKHKKRKIVQKKAIIKEKPLAPKKSKKSHITVQKKLKNEPKAKYSLAEKKVEAKPVAPIKKEVLPENTTDENSEIVSTEKQRAPPAQVTAHTGGSQGKSSSKKAFQGSSNKYFHYLMTTLNKHKSYPVNAKQHKEEGIVLLQFTLNEKGEVIAQKIKKSSGFPDLDAAALEMLFASSPLPVPPTQLQRPRLTLVLPIDYSLITNNNYAKKHYKE